MITETMLNKAIVSWAGDLDFIEVSQSESLARFLYKIIEKSNEKTHHQSNEEQNA